MSVPAVNDVMSFFLQPFGPIRTVSLNCLVCHGVLKKGKTIHTCLHILDGCIDDLPVPRVDCTADPKVVLTQLQLHCKELPWFIIDIAKAVGPPLVLCSFPCGIPNSYFSAMHMHAPIHTGRHRYCRTSLMMSCSVNLRH